MTAEQVAASSVTGPPDDVIAVTLRDGRKAIMGYDDETDAYGWYLPDEEWMGRLRSARQPGGRGRSTPPAIVISAAARLFPCEDGPPAPAPAERRRFPARRLGLTRSRPNSEGERVLAHLHDPAGVGDLARSSTPRRPWRRLRRLPSASPVPGLPVPGTRPSPGRGPCHTVPAAGGRRGCRW